MPMNCRSYSLRVNRYVGVWLALTLVALALAGCGNTAATPGASNSSTVSGSAVAGGANTIKVGVDIALSGVIAANGQSVLGAVKLWADQVNASGGILGKPVQLVVEDDASDPKTANEKAKALVGQGVAVVTGPILSAERNAVQPVITGAGIPFLYSTWYEGGAYDPLMFIDAETPEQQTKGYIPWLVQQHGPRFYFIGSDYVYPRTSNAKAKDFLAAAGGQTVGEEYVALGTTDFSSSLARIAKANPDVVFADVVGTDAIALLKQFYDYGLAKDIHFASTGHVEPILEGVGPQASEGMSASFGYFANLDTPENNAFVAGFKKIEAKVPPMTVSARTYAILQMWAMAVEKAGTTDGQAVRKAFEGLTIEKTPVGSLTMDPYQHHTAAHMYIAVAHNGQYQVVKDLGVIQPGNQRQ